MTGWTIEPGHAGDIDAVLPIMAAAFDPRFGEAWSASQLLGTLALPGAALHFARRDGAPIGFALSRSVADSCELMLLGVTPAAARKGCGRALLDTVIAEAIVRRAKSLYLEMRSGNAAARLYSSSGFVRVGTRPGYYRGPGGAKFDGETWRRDLS